MRKHKFIHTFITALAIIALFAPKTQAQQIIGYSGLFTFDTQAPAISLIQPNTNAYFASNGQIPVTWQANGNLKPNPIRIKLITQPGNQVFMLEENLPNSGSTEIILPDINTSNAKIIIEAEDEYGNIAQDISDESFAVYDIKLELSSAYYDGGDYYHYNANEPTLLLKLTNNTSIELTNLSFESSLDGNECQVVLKPTWYQDFDTNNDGLLDILDNNSSKHVLVKSSPIFDNSIQNKQLLVKINEINGIPANIKIEKSLSFHYIKNASENNRPFALDKDTYAFQNDDVTDMSFITFLQILLTSGFEQTQTAMHLFSYFFTINGNCFGMSATVGSYWLHPEYKPLQGDVFQWPLTNFQVRENIYKYQVRQLLFYVNSLFYNFSYDELINRLNNNNPVVVLIEKPGALFGLKNWRHAILAIKATKIDDEAYIGFYENELTYTPKEGILNFQDGTFQYGPKGEWSNPKLINQNVLNPLQLQRDDELVQSYFGRLPALVYEGGKKIYAVANPAHTYLENEAGEKSGYLPNGQLIDEIPEAEILKIPTYTTEYDSITMIAVPMEGNYQAHIHPYRAGLLRFEVYNPIEEMLLETATIHALETQENADLFFNDEETNQLKVDINGDGSIDEVEPLTVSEITSTNAYFSPENSLHITPNPVSDEVLIKLPDKEALNTTLTINIYNVNGIKVFNKIIANPSGNEINLSLSHLPAGVYILQIFDNETAYAAKLIIN